MRHNIHAYTEPTPEYPGYVSINRDERGVHTITVRSPGNGGRDCATLELTTEQLEAMSTDVLADLHRVEWPAFDVSKLVDRFLGWPLPEDFGPDCYVSFDREKARQGSWPVGTNLFTADQARAMFEYVTG